jgi:D-alanyl-D-alanine carboxypeptidase
LAELVESMQVPSAVVVVRSSEFGDATFRFGSRVLGGDDLPATSDHYRIGSITKTMTATVILQLAQEGKLSLDDPISKYRPEVPNGDTITIAQLLDMRSGLAGYTEDPVFWRAAAEDPGRTWTPDELLALAFNAPAMAEPGTAWHYSNTNYILLGLVMQDVTGQTVPELFQQRLFDPLGLDSTVMPALDDASIPATYAHGYQFGTTEQTFGADPALPADEQRAVANGEMLPADWSGANPSIAWTAGSVISTADDLAVWTNALVDGGVLDAEMQAQRLASIQPIDPAQPDGPAYGSGMIRAGSYYGHGGQIWGYESQVIRDPETDTTVVALAALSVSPDGRGPASELSRAVRAHLPETA